MAIRCAQKGSLTFMQFIGQQKCREQHVLRIRGGRIAHLLQFRVDHLPQHLDVRFLAGSAADCMLSTADCQRDLAQFSSRSISRSNCFKLLDTVS